MVSRIDFFAGYLHGFAYACMYVPSTIIIMAANNSNQCNLMSFSRTDVCMYCSFFKRCAISCNFIFLGLTIRSPVNQLYFLLNIRIIILLFRSSSCFSKVCGSSFVFYFAYTLVGLPVSLWHVQLFSMCFYLNVGHKGGCTILIYLDA